MINKLLTNNVIGHILKSVPILIPSVLTFLLIIGSFALTFTSLAPISFFVFGTMVLAFKKWQFKISPISEMIERAYDNFFFFGKTLSNLKVKPMIAIGSSNLETGRPFTFSKDRMSDSFYKSKNKYDPPIEYLHSKFPVARAFMASSSVPGVFTPIQIDKEFYKFPGDFNRVHPQLVDGGVYDNQGIQKITQPKSNYECRMIITSDAGNQFFANEKYPNSIALLIRTVGLFMNRIKTFKLVQNVYRNTEGVSRPIAYISLGWRVEKLIPGFINNLIEGQVTKYLSFFSKILFHFLISDIYVFANPIFSFIRISTRII